MRLNQMVIVDLYSQRNAVAAQLREIESCAKLDWLRGHGELIDIPVPSPFPPTYMFRSRQGIETKFVIRDGQMIFLADHTTAGAVDIGE